MGCCLAAALVFAVVRRVWCALVPSAPSGDTGFAPPARYPATARSEPAPRPRRTSALATGLAAGVVAYLVSTDVLALAGLVEVPQTWTAAWLVRLLATAVLVGAAWTAVTGARESWDRDAAVLAIAAAAAAWSLASVLEMHALGLVTMTSSSFALDAVIHGGGLLTAALLVPLVRFRSTPLTTEVAA
jgi:hypothetical protein